jgi:hypothetical protein
VAVAVARIADLKRIKMGLVEVGGEACLFRVVVSVLGMVR